MSDFSRRLRLALALEGVDTSFVFSRKDMIACADALEAQERAREGTAIVINDGSLVERLNTLAFCFEESVESVIRDSLNFSEGNPLLTRISEAGYAERIAALVQLYRRTVAGHVEANPSRTIEEVDRVYNEAQANGIRAVLIVSAPPPPTQQEQL